MHMIGLRMRTLAAVPLMLSGLGGCETWQMTSAIDRLKPATAAHAEALAGEDMVEARKTGLALIVQLSAYAGWSK
jgi:hypothetical protein